MTLTSDKSFEENLEVLRLSVGESAVSRIRALRACGDNWDGQGAVALCEKSLASFARLSQNISLASLRVGIYLNDDGTLFINWKGKNDRLINVDFCCDNIQVITEDVLQNFLESDPALIKILEKS